jgi:two-component system OmpR family sensor kinase
MPERLNPRRWPVRWRLAIVSAALTFVILVVFALVVGRLTSQRLESDFNDDVQGTAVAIAGETRLHQNPFTGDIQPHVRNPQLQRMVLVPNSAICIVHRSGLPYECTQEAGGLAIPPTGTVKQVGTYSVGSFPIQNTSQSFDPLFIEYARDRSGLDDTIDRLWLFLGLGVLGGTGLAFLAGLMVARRAMRPVRALTGAARNVAATRDPSQAVPQPEAQDEIAELARTLDEMLKELDAARSETEQMVQTQREFIADASHELRTPLTSILANLELLQAQLDDAQRQGEEGEIVGSALRSSRRMGRLVSDLLLLARADAGRTSPRRDCDLAEIAAAALSELRPVANGHELVLAAEGPVPVEGNPDELHRLAVNLLDNGLRHTPAGTAIEMSVDRQNGLAVLEVTDDGPGLPQGMEEQVFARFVRGGGPADVAGDSGVGLGLAIVKAVATSHGGEVEAGASTGGGARFTVRLPVGKS